MATAKTAVATNNGNSDPSYSLTYALLNFQGANNSTTITDEAAISGSYTAFGNAKLSTDQFIYGTSSAYFDGSAGTSIRRSSMITVSASQSWTMEGWFRPSENSRTGSLDGITLRGNSGSTTTIVSLDFYNPSASNLRPVFGGVNQSGTAVIINTGSSFGVIANTWYYYIITNNVDTNQIKLNIGAAGSSLQEFSTSGARTLTLNDIGCWQGSTLNAFTERFLGYTGPTRLTVGVARTPVMPTGLFPNS